MPHAKPSITFRKQLYSRMMEPRGTGNYQKTLDRWISILIIMNVLAIIAEHIPLVYQPYQHFFNLFDIFSVAVFTLEYAFRLYLCEEDPVYREARSPKLSFIFSVYGLIDLLAILPFFLKAFISIDLRVLRLLRLLRVLKLFRFILPAAQSFMQLNRGRTFRQKVHALVYPSDYGGDLHAMFDGFIVFWVLVSVIAVILESVNSIHRMLNLEFIVLDTIAVAVFTAEYALRLYSCVEEPAYAHGLWGRLNQARRLSFVVDLLSILPFFLEAALNHLVDLRFLRVFRMMRLLKLNRHSSATQTLMQVVYREWSVLWAAGFIMMLLVIMMASLGYLFEHEAQPDKFENIPQAIYWGVITLTSVGYGDIAPVTPAGRIITVLLAIMGIGIFAIPAALLTSAFSDQLRQEREALREQLYKMLADGVFSDDEADVVHREATRLHLTQNDVNRLIQRARLERQARETYASLPLHRIAENPAHAVEHYKTLLSQIRQLGFLTDHERFEAVARVDERLSAAELALWYRIHTLREESPPSGENEAL